MISRRLLGRLAVTATLLIAAVFGVGGAAFANGLGGGDGGGGSGYENCMPYDDGPIISPGYVTFKAHVTCSDAASTLQMYGINPSGLPIKSAGGGYGGIVPCSPNVLCTYSYTVALQGHGNYCENTQFLRSDNPDGPGTITVFPPGPLPCVDYAGPTTVSDGELIQVVFADTGLCLDAFGTTHTSGEQLDGWACKAVDNQYWWYNKTGTSTFELQSASAPSLCANLWTGSSADGTPIKLYPCNSTNENFTLQPHGIFQYLAPASAKASAVSLTGANPTNGALVHLWHIGASEKQYICIQNVSTNTETC